MKSVYQFFCFPDGFFSQCEAILFSAGAYRFSLSALTTGMI
jgi:hypothetical protein